ncbi:MAG: response regulator [Candidatus Methylomirabilis oxygeniifera]|uniref:Putative Two-component transcriptional regulator putative transcriptional regulator involved in heavy-metal (Cu/Zn) homeostasis n=1 Tax=Methylomirabilis oxygeniifera TaxID=671143 RepID=D5MLP3_METO1|nr:MAG: response regulator [Candidatus Methylomirabilis oxyfera]CBE69950.1 putative Two-component transcriptional regulator; putative transcriptional regulator involved in heavy-metal (Cu/Zn) homeostasis [Candidatus Methylomirabilis oxyfera]
MRLLLVEDDQKAARVLKKGLAEEGVVVDIANSGDEGEYLASVNDYDVIVLDWLLPGKDGIQLCRELRARGLSTPILMVTAKDALRDRIKGLDTGADDYMVKPFAFAELLARIRALMRRGTGPRPTMLRVADLVIDPASHRVTRGGASIKLTTKEYAIIEFLARRVGEVVTRTTLGEHIWEDEFDNLTNLVDVHISNLRKKIDAGSTVSLIHTVRGRGYRLSEEQE